ncbi:hypothetical protein WR25_26988 [Diploscapter pachys]|uniref:F-box domain-containing protein n=1 Tax=Diploscapter pachys TaxID=2018661 RepID=A0A2A2L367_9BILA|nr:hypothetical protein WR25_26988 [Diploscapter pachys]
MSHLPQTTLVDLPPEVLQIIFSRLPIGDLGQIQRVNKYLHGVANEIKNPAGKRLAYKNRIGITVHFVDQDVPEDEHQLEFIEIANIEILDRSEARDRSHPRMTIRVPCCDRHPQPTEEQTRNVRQEWPSMKIQEFFKPFLEKIEARINEARENNPNYALNNKLPISVHMEQAFWTRIEAFDYLKDLLFYIYYEYGYVDSLELIMQMNMTNNCLEIVLKNFYENCKGHVGKLKYSFGMVGPIDLEKSLKSLPPGSVAQIREDAIKWRKWMLTNRHNEKFIIAYKQFAGYYMLLIRSGFDPESTS